MLLLLFRDAVIVGAAIVFVVVAVFFAISVVVRFYVMLACDVVVESALLFDSGKLSEIP